MTDPDLLAAFALYPAHVPWLALGFACLGTIASSVASVGIVRWATPRARVHPEHWTETARRSSVFTRALLPSLLGNTASWTTYLLLRPTEVHPLPIGVEVMALGLCTWAAHQGVIAGILRWRHIPVWPHLRGMLALMLLRSTLPLVIVALALALPPTGWVVPLAFGATLMVVVASMRGATLHLARGLGWAWDPPEWLRSASSAPVTVLAGTHVNAFAFPHGQRIVVTQGALDGLSQDECLAILAHEQGHLDESERTKAGRLVGVPLLLTIALWNPILHTIGVEGLVAIAVLGSLPLFVVRRWIRSLESAADEAAGPHRHADLARALESTYRLNGMPIVTRGGNTHPDLYDRLLALGHTPPYARPEPIPRSVLGLVGVLVPMVMMIGLFLGLQPPVRPDPEANGFWVGVSDPANMFIQAGDQHRLHAPDQALLLFRAATVLRPRSAQGFAGMAWTTHHLGRTEEARGWAHWARTLEGWDDWCAYLLADLPDPDPSDTGEDR